MAKSNTQIQQEYAGRGTLAKLGIAADDLVRLAAGGLTGGLLDNVLGGDNVERTREAAVRAGVVGDVAKVAGMALGLKGAGGALSTARTLPTAINATKSAGLGQGLRVLTNTAGPGLIPVAAKTAVSKGALAKGAGLLGLLGISAAGRQDGGVEAPADLAGTVKTAGAQEIVPTTRAAAAPTAQDRAMAAIDTILRQPFTIGEFEAATGALPQVAASGAKVSNKDKVFGAASGIADTLYQAQLAQAAKLTGDAKDAAVLQATENYRRNLLETLGVDPSKQALAEAIAAQAGE